MTDVTKTLHELVSECAMTQKRLENLDLAIHTLKNLGKGEVVTVTELAAWPTTKKRTKK